MTTLVNFNGINGKNPAGGVTIDSQGNLYGTTYDGGVTAINNAVNGYGTIWKWSPTGGLKTLVSFNGANGMFPTGGVTMDAQGNLFGATTDGGTTGNGVVFEYSAGGVLSTLVDFDGRPEAPIPSSALCLDGQGNLYGVVNLPGPGGYGTIFAVQPVSTTLRISSMPVSSDGRSGRGHGAGNSDHQRAGPGRRYRGDSGQQQFLCHSSGTGHHSGGRDQRRLYRQYASRSPTTPRSRSRRGWAAARSRR